MSLRAVQVVNAFYEAAEHGGPDENHWAGVGNLSARQANSPSVRETLRNRARYEVANNPIARGITDTLADDLIGDGPIIQVRATAGGLTRQEAQQVERAWMDWTDAVDLWGKIRLLRNARTHDGEGFALRTTNESLSNPVKLDLAVIETERVCNPNSIDLDLSEVDGIKFDKGNNPSEYRVLAHNPDDDILARIRDDASWQKAADVIHYFRADRAGQVRGVPEMTPALAYFAKLRRFTTATLLAAETAANNAQVIYTDSPVDSEGREDPEPMDTIQLAAGTATVLPDGWKLGQMQAEHPTTTFAEFRRQIANEIGRCFSMPVNLVLADSSQHNYASGKLDWALYYKKVRVDRRELQLKVLDRVFRWWFDEAVRVTGLLPQRLRSVNAPFRWGWMWPAWEHADPSKEAAGQKARIELGVTNLQIECARIGLDWQDVMDGRLEVQEYSDSIGLTPPAPAASGQDGQAQGDEQDEEADNARRR